MGIAAYLKEIGRGKEGARSLSTEQAHDLFNQVLDRTVTDLEIGAFALAMRIKGETASELQGFVRSAHEHCVPLPLPLPTTTGNSPSKGIVVLPSYNGARKLPNLTALLAAQLAREGVSVLVHGPLLDPSRITTAQVWQALGWQTANQTSDVTACWSQSLPAFMPISSLCPSLSALLDVRWTIGLRNPGHTIAKLLCPWPASVPVAQVVNHTHPEYALSLTDYLMQSDCRALLMRGTEGEPVADARRQPRFDVFIKGKRLPELSCQPQEGVLQSLPNLPDSRDADITANYIQEVLSDRQAMPTSIQQQVDCLINMLSN